MILQLDASGRFGHPVATLADGNDAAFFGHLQAAERATLKRILQELVAQHRLGNPPVG